MRPGVVALRHERLARNPIEFFGVVPSGEKRQIAGTVKPDTRGRFVSHHLSFEALTYDHWLVWSLIIDGQDLIVGNQAVPAGVFEGMTTYPRHPAIATEVDRVAAVSLTVENRTQRSKACRALLHPYDCVCPLCCF